MKRRQVRPRHIVKRKGDRPAEDYSIHEAFNYIANHYHYDWLPLDYALFDILCHHEGTAVVERSIGVFLERKDGPRFEAAAGLTDSMRRPDQVSLILPVMTRELEHERRAHRIFSIIKILSYHGQDETVYRFLIDRGLTADYWTRQAVEGFLWGSTIELGVDRTPTWKLLEALTHDPDHDIRWGSLYDLVDLAESREQLTPILERMRHDTHVSIRRYVKYLQNTWPPYQWDGSEDQTSQSERFSDVAGGIHGGGGRARDTGALFLKSLSDV